MSKRYWLVKQEPETYSWDDLVRDGKTDWTGIRNFQARNNLRDMKVGDAVLFYHSGKEKAVVGVAEVVKEAYADPTADEGEWVAVDIKAKSTLSEPLTIANMRTDAALQEVPLLPQSQLSVMPIRKSEFDHVVKNGKVKKL
jgi:predicted RNA-binding protein with PUA-like domain